VERDVTLKRDAYEVLGVSRDADEREIKRTFRRLARELHPDVNRHDHDAEERFKEAAEAYEILSDAERRQIYDRYGYEGLSSRGREPSFAGFGSLSDIFDAFFGGGDPFGGGRRGPGGGGVQGGDVAVAAEISLADAAAGRSVTVEYEAVAACERCRGNGAEPGTPIETCGRCGGSGKLRSTMRSAFGQIVRAHLCDACGGEGKLARTPCQRCRGRGREARRVALDVDVPAGIADDQRIRLSGRGHAGERGGPPGDLYVIVRVTEDERFVRDGNDLVTVVDVSAPAAALGTSVQVPTLEGEERVELEPGTQPGSVITLAGRGMPSLGRSRRGDQRVVVNVVVPRALSARQRELLDELEGSLEERNLWEPDHNAHESLFARVRRALG
jgi:molecular chaperone DnaJ